MILRPSHAVTAKLRAVRGGSFVVHIENRSQFEHNGDTALFASPSLGKQAARRS